MLHDHILENGDASPYSAYRFLSTSFNAGLVGLAGATTLLRRFKAPLAVPDLLTFGLAAHKIAVIVTKERVTMPLRSPFTTQADGGRAGGHESKPRGHGLQRALGELVTCPHCTAPWVALGLITGYVIAPLPTRAISTLFATVALASAFCHADDWLQAQEAQANGRAKVQSAAASVASSQVQPEA